MITEPITKNNLTSLTKLVLELWPECVYEEEYENCERILNSLKETCFLGKEGENYVAFIYITLRSDYVEGATTSPVGYVEGIYVQPEYRNKGNAKSLVELAENWFREKDCKAYASDTEMSNKESIAFHKRVGFEEINHIVHFLKELPNNEKK